MSEVLTEILRADPNFDKDRFLRQCESDIIPNILEVRSMLQLWWSPGLLHPSPAFWVVTLELSLDYLRVTRLLGLYSEHIRCS